MYFFLTKKYILRRNTQMNELKQFTDVSYDALPEVFKSLHYWKTHRKKTDTVYKLLSHLGMDINKENFNDAVDNATIRYVEEFRKEKQNPIDFIEYVRKQRKKNINSLRIEETDIGTSVDALESYIVSSLISRHAMNANAFSSRTLYIIDELYKYIESNLYDGGLIQPTRTHLYETTTPDFYDYKTNDEFFTILQLQASPSTQNFTDLVKLLADNAEQKRLGKLLKQIITHNNYEIITQNRHNVAANDLYVSVISNIDKYDEPTKLELVGYIDNEILQCESVNIQRVFHVAMKRKKVINNLKK